jgi:hypothetical protein
MLRNPGLQFESQCLQALGFWAKYLTFKLVLQNVGNDVAPL